MKLSPVSLALLAILALAGGDALALSLGEVRSSSHIGERLLAEIDLSVQADERLDAGCVRLMPSRVDDGIPALRQGSLSVRGGLKPAIVVRSTGFVQEPALRLSLNIGCGFDVQRDYLVLLSPPASEEPTRVAAPVVRAEMPAEPAVTHRHIAPMQIRPLAAVEPASVEQPSRRETRLPQDKKPPAPPVLRDRIYLTAPGEIGEPGLRLSSELLSWRGEDAQREAQRELLRLEFRMLQALHEQALAQLDASEKLRQMEATLGELQQRSAEFSRRLEQRTETPAVSTPVVAEPMPPKAQAELRSRRNLTEWIFYAGLMCLAAFAGGWLVWRNRQVRIRQNRAALTLIPEPYIDPRRDSEIDDFDAVAPPAAASAGKTPDFPADGVPVLINQSPNTVSASAALPGLSQASIGAATVAEHFEVNPVMELADIMLSFGRVKGAAQALQEFIDQNPEEALQPWIRLMDVYRLAGMRNEFERVAAELNQHFNVEIQRWDSSAADERKPAVVEPVEPLPIEWQTTARENRSIEDLEHIADHVVSLWPRAECKDYLDKLLRDNRGGQRSGFSLPVVDEILFLIELLATLTKMEEEGAAK